MQVCNHVIEHIVLAEERIDELLIHVLMRYFFVGSGCVFNGDLFLFVL